MFSTDCQECCSNLVKANLEKLKAENLSCIKKDSLEADLELGEDVSFMDVSSTNSPAVMTFKNLTVRTKSNQKKILLKSVSGIISGGLWAVMGTSGCGKTTLVNALALRVDQHIFEVSGEMRLNGRTFDNKILKSMSAYVMQDDLLHAELTVRETLGYASELRIPEGITKEAREAREEEVLRLMGIEHCKDTIVGDTRKKGISGGERKRLCVAIELLNRPKLLFLDEPITGLDSSTALSLCQALKNLTDSGACTIVCAIHQPQPKTFNIFDSLILMKRGSIAYQGATMKTMVFLTKIEISLPPGDNIADFLMDVIAPGKEYSGRVDEECNKVRHVDLAYGSHKQAFYDKGLTSWWNQFRVLVHRNTRQYIRRHDIILLHFVGTSVLGLFISLGIWFDIGTGQESLKTREPSLFFSCVAQAVLGSLQSINSFPSERAIMLRERSSGAYRTSAYFMAKSAVDVFVSQLWPAVLFSCVVYYTIGYQPQADKFLIFTVFIILDSMAACSLATCVTCICVSVEMSTVVLPCFMLNMLYGGFLASPADLNAPEMSEWRFATALSYSKYTFVGMALNEMHGLHLTCPGDGTGTTNDTAVTCDVTTGEQISAEKGYDQYTIGYCAGVLFAFIIGYRVLGYIGLRLVKV